MKALASKSSDKSAVKSASYKQAVPTPQANSFSTTQNNGFVIQRKPGCACGGGCPRCKEEATIQTKLRIGEPGDKYEQEADRVSEQVMRMPESAVQRQVEQEEEEEELLQAKPLAGQITPVIQRQVEDEEEEEEELLQAKSAPGQTPEVTPALANGINALRGGGQPLDPATRAYMEPRFGHDFRSVRVHADARAAAKARAVSARAFALGNGIFFAQGQYQPETLTGRQLLAHELTHVVQQVNGSLARTVQCWRYGVNNHRTVDGLYTSFTDDERERTNGMGNAMAMIDRIRTDTRPGPRRCRRWFEDHCWDRTAAPGTMLQVLDDRAIIWMWRLADQTPDIQREAPLGDTSDVDARNHAVTEQAVQSRDRFLLAGTMIHEYWHDCAAFTRPDIGDEATRVCGLT